MRIYCASSFFLIKNQFNKLFGATSYSFAGLKVAVTERAFCLELICAVILIPLAFLISHVALIRIILIFSIILVLIIELLNSAIESIIDRISSDHHPLSKKAKDFGSAAVFLAIVNVIIVWLIVLL